MGQNRRRQREQKPTPVEESEPFWTPRRRALAVGLFIFVVIGGGVFADWWTCLPDSLEARYVGRQTCAQCHQQELTAWSGSHHDLAMDEATEKTVLGDFADATIEHFGVTSKMYRDHDRFMVRTEGPDGKLADFQVKYVFGVEPLQQYMVEFDRPENAKPDEIGRVQVLRITWDTEKKKWFYLSPPDVDEKLEPDDDLHWTGVAQRWNNMCADCHSTNLQKNFNLETKRYHTTFSEIDVSCESCHGPGSVHIQLAKSKSLFWDRKRGYGLARLKNKNDNNAEIQACAQCHSRRRLVHPNYRPDRPFYDHFGTELLQELTYYPDGQIKDEVYVHGSFLQSKMYHKGIRCTDCHDPHTARLKHTGNRVCTSCHQHQPGRYDAPSHHHHQPNSTGASCVECHMPSTTYMEVDARRDHSLRIPRPDLSVELKTPNACVGCHLGRKEDRPKGEQFSDLKLYQDWLVAARDRPAVAEQLQRLNEWAAKAVGEWFPETPEKRSRPPHFAHALARARRGEREAAPGLIRIVKNRTLPAIVRATAVQELGRFMDAAGATDTTLAAVKDDSPLVRTASVGNLQALGVEQIARYGADLLSDPVRMVRAEAARVLASVPPRSLTGPQREMHTRAIAEFTRGVLLSNDRASAHLSLAILNESLGRDRQAERTYRLAMELEPGYTGPRTNLAALLDRRLQALEQRMRQLTIQRNREEALRLAEDAAKLKTEIDRLRLQELSLLARDAKLAPDNAPVQYRFGLSLYLQGRNAEAEKALRRATELEPNRPDFAEALATFFHKFKRIKEARRETERWLTISPNDRRAKNLLRVLDRGGAGAGPQFPQRD